MIADLKKLMAAHAITEPAYLNMVYTDGRIADHDRSNSPRARNSSPAAKSAVPNGVGMFNHATAAKASGATITDADGRELIDFAGGIGVVNAGHCPPPVVKAIQEQAAKFLHVSFNVASYEPYIALCEKLNALLPHGGPTKTLLVSTGAEAVENAIKIARQATKRQGVLCFTDAFHGRTMMAMTLDQQGGLQAGLWTVRTRGLSHAIPEFLPVRCRTE
jgi:4-aminobutyrate aminotransferase-like enzyme